MELQDFIANTLRQIALGIEAASESLKNSKAIVNPRNVSIANDEAGIYGYLDTKRKFYKVVQKIDFDVAVTAEKGRENKKGVGIHVGSIGIGAQGRLENNNSTVSRIRFSIPMVLPMDNAPHDQRDPGDPSESTIAT